MPELDLTHFEVVLHIALLQNFIYAVSNEFSEKIFPLLSSPFRNSFSNSLKKATEQLTDLKEGRTPDATKIFDENYLRLDTKVKAFTTISAKDYKFGPRFKALYLLGGLYCFFLLLIACFPHGYLQEESCCCLSYANGLILFFYFIAFLLTFFKKPPVIKLVFVLFYFFFTVLFVFIFYNLGEKYHIHICWDGECSRDNDWMTITSIVIVLSPIMLHIIRASMKLIYDFVSINSEINSFNKAVKRLTINKTPPPNTSGDILDDYDNKIR